MLCFITENSINRYFDHAQVVAINPAPQSGTFVVLSNGQQIFTSLTVSSVAINIARAQFDVTQTPINVGA